MHCYITGEFIFVTGIASPLCWFVNLVLAWIYDRFHIVAGWFLVDVIQDIGRIHLDYINLACPMSLFK